MGWCERVCVRVCGGGQCGLRLPSGTMSVLADIRVGISQAVDHPWRFLAADHPHVSVPHGKVKVPMLKPPKQA